MQCRAIWRNLPLVLCLAISLAANSQAEEAKATASAAAEPSASLLTIGSPAPPLKIEHWFSDAHGRFPRTGRFEDGKIYVVEFWATWCGPCVASMPHLAKLQAAYADRGVQIISISDESIDTIEAFLERTVGDRGRVADKEKSESGENQATTYQMLTSAYCLTTDPDGSSSRDYMEAAKQNGIPTSFVVGKSGVIEWIGHPAELDDILPQVAADRWDREGFAKEFRRVQEREALMAAVSAAMQEGNTEQALKLLADARGKAEGDAATLSMLDDLELRIRLTPIMRKVENQEIDDALESLERFIKSASPKQQFQLKLFRASILMNTDRTQQTIAALKSITDDENADEEVLNMIAWNLYEASRQDADFDQGILDGAVAMAEKAVALAPKNGSVLDTLARLLHRRGDVPRAIELENKAIELDPPNAAVYRSFLESIR